MPLEYALWPACVKAHGFTEQLAAASAAGFDRLPIGPLTYRELLRQGHSARDIVRMAEDHGLALGHFDGFANWTPYPYAPSTPEAARAVFADSADECLRSCDELGLPAICATGVFDPSLAELPVLVDAFGAFCERAAAGGIRVDLEFIPMWGIPDLEAAWNIVGGAACGNAGILLDSWHFFRGNPDFELLRSLPSGSIRTVQLADAALQYRGADLFEDCLRFRMVPGEGELDLVRLLQVLADIGGVASVGAEIFSDELDRLPADTAALRVAQASAALLDEAGFSTPDSPAAARAGGVNLQAADVQADNRQPVLH